jgi:hypothetical protein
MIIIIIEDCAIYTSEFPHFGNGAEKKYCGKRTAQPFSKTYKKKTPLHWVLPEEEERRQVQLTT